MRTRLTSFAVWASRPRSSNKCRRAARTPRSFAYLTILLALLVPGDAQAEAPAISDGELFARAESAFRQGVENQPRLLQARKHFTESAEAYKELHRRGVRSPALYANLGNAALLADHWPEAIWAYHVGLVMNPNDPAMREHLAFARAKVIYPPAGQGRLDHDAWPAWLHRPTICDISCILGICYFLAWIAGLCAFISRQPRWFLLTAMLIVMTVSGGACLWYELRQADNDRRTPRVVLVDNTEFFRGNGASYPQHPVLPVLPRGLEVRQLHRRGAWLQIRLTTGEIGWVHAGNALVVEP